MNQGMMPMIKTTLDLFSRNALSQKFTNQNKYSVHSCYVINKL